MTSRILLICSAILLLSQVSFAHPHPEDGDRHEHGHFHSHGLRRTQQGANATGTSDQDLLTTSSSLSRCGSKDPPEAWRKESARIIQKWRTNLRLGGIAQVVSTIVVPTYFHVITDGTAGAISNSQLQQQLQVLNDSYQPYGFSFSLQQTIRTDNGDWYSSGAFSFGDEAMKTALRRGGASSLNVYFKDTGSLLGYATFPDEYTDSPKLDGVIVLGRSVPGGDASPYNEGKTLVHEVGHWLGLYHTFQPGTSLFSIIPFFSLFFGCFTDGDLIDDTPAQRSSTFGCPTRKDTCWLQSGSDPVHNYMDYSDDACYNEFTAGQAERMLAMWNEYRA